MSKFLGIDIGSTTVKATVIDGGKIEYGSYIRHYSQVRQTVLDELMRIRERFGDDFRLAITGSAGIGFAERCELDFVQEVQAAYIAIRRFYPDADVSIELGGEDAKIIFITGGSEQRMNGSCAGGTGAFIDQMATLLNVTVGEMDELALGAEKVYPIASRCGVFAKSDIQPLINQGAKKEDIAASIFQAVVDQTVSGLAQGRKIKGKVLFLGGPLYFFKSLRKAFKTTLKLSDENAVFPDDAPRFMSIGAALYAANASHCSLSDVIERVKSDRADMRSKAGRPLFWTEEEYEEFAARHSRANIPTANIETYEGKCYLGIDSGSTTTKIVAVTEQSELLWSCYLENNGQPLDITVDKLKEFYAQAGKKITVAGCAVTGYGEDLIKSAIKADFGIVETIAHFKAALFFDPRVDFIIDIGGQDIKCFKIKNGAIDSIMLNEACSSGCGSFIQTFAKAMGMSIADFAKEGLFARHPVELGSRCTVFMNSSVKQAQKEGAGIDDISAGLSSSIVKNAIYKVIRTNPDRLGEHIVVQGGTFLNDAVLRAFELEIGKPVIRPCIAGLMGAFGAALYAKECSKGTSSVMTDLDGFTYTSRSSVCKGCTSYCNINIVSFDGGRKFISGNKCERGAGLKLTSDPLDIYTYKQERLLECVKGVKGKIKVGLPLQLSMYEQLPLWAGFFETLGFEVVLSDKSSRNLYFRGQHTVASDTVCYPAKLMHGHIESLLDKGVDFIFLPCESYNLDEKYSSNHYNCPIVAYYPELLKANNDRLNDNFIMPYIDLNRRQNTVKNLQTALSRFDVPAARIKEALKNGLKRMREYHRDVAAKSEEIIREAEKLHKHIIVLCGRPYHLDAEINHGINKLLTSLGVAVLSEDGVFEKSEPVKVNVLNQWTYHARLYRAANFVSKHRNIDLVQLVSFGCGLDAITSDEVRAILEKHDRLYTQIKIDDINNAGVVKIRLRSMLAALEEAK